MSKSLPISCDLCGLPVETGDFQLATTAGPKQFCCEGCHGIYQMLHEDEIVDTAREDLDLQASTPSR